MYCICCKKNNVIPNTPPISSKIATEDSPPQHEEDILWKDSKRKDGLVNVNNDMIDTGIIHIIDAGYGSTHDGDQLVIAICDDCIKENLKDATILYYGNYMYGGDYANDEIEKSKKAYRRRKNLDSLT